MLIQVTLSVQRVIGVSTPVCNISSQYETNCLAFAAIYEDSQQKYPIAVVNAKFSVDVDNSLCCLSCDCVKYQKYDKQNVFLRILPQYYLQPWKVVLCCISYKQDSEFLWKQDFKASVLSRYCMFHEEVESRNLFCFHSVPISTVSDNAESYVIHCAGYCDSLTEFIFTSSALYPSVPENPYFSQLPKCRWQDFLSVYPRDGSLIQTYQQLLHLLQWNRHVFEACCSGDSSNLDSYKSSNILISGTPGTGKTSLLYAVVEQLDIPCLMADIPQMLLSKGSDAPVALRELFASCKKIAPSVLVIDPLNVIAADNSSRRIDRSEMDLDFLKEFSCIVEEAKYSGVTIIGVTTDEAHVQSRVLHAFDETIHCFVPSQIERSYYFRHLANHFIDFGEHTDSPEWQQQYIDYLSLQTPSFSWSDINCCLKVAINRCTEKSVSGRCCCLCLLQAVQKHSSDTTTLQNTFVTRAVSSDLSVISSFWNSFSSIGGSEEIKKQLIETIVNPCLHWEDFRYFGISPPTGILLYGPPGTGKTAISRACSQIGHLNFICPQISDLICKEIGESERQIRELFSQARRCAPCILFFDEIESIFKNRSIDDTSTVSQQIVTQLLLMMDDVRRDNQLGNNKFVFIIGATNLPEQLDPALLRPGRLDLLIFVPLPSAVEREVIIHIYGDKSLLFDEVSVAELARLTEGYSGADLKFLVRSILLNLIRSTDSTQRLKGTRFSVTNSVVMKSLREVHASTNQDEYKRLLKWKA